MGYVPAPQTCFKSVKALCPGTYLVRGPTGSRAAEFWRMRFDTGGRQESEDECAERAQSLLQSSVRSHLAADVDVGALLSGGWDSSLVAALAARQMSKRLKTFSLTLPDSAINEARYQRAMARHLNSDHYEIEFRARDIPELIPKGILHLEQPLDGPALLDFQISRLASSQVKVALSGQGADELFAGYPWAWNEPQFRRLRRAIPSYLASALMPVATSISRGRAARLLAARDPVDAHIESRRLFSPSEMEEILSEHVPRGRADMAAYRVDPRVLSTCRNGLDHRLAYDYSVLMPNMILNYHDKMSMAHSLEVRMPFLDSRMIDFALQLPSTMKVRNGQPKYILSLLGHLLPPEVRDRKKQGLQYPLREHLEGPLKPFVKEFLLDSNGSSAGILNRQKLEKALDRWLTPGSDTLREPWGLIGLQTWWNVFFSD